LAEPDAVGETTARALQLRLQIVKLHVPPRPFLRTRAFPDIQTCGDPPFSLDIAGL
jgi:hypothetical protein